MSLNSVSRARSGARPRVRLRRTTSGLALLGVLAATAACGGDDGSDDENSDDTNSSTTDTGSPETRTTETESGESETAFADLPVDEIKSEAIADTRSVQSLRMKGTFRSEGKDSKIDIRMDNKASCRGSIGIDAAEAQFIATPTGSFIKGNRDFWVESAGESQADTVLGRLGAKWAKLPPGDQSFAGFCDLDDVLDDFEDDGGAAGVEKGEISEIDGVEVIELKSSEENSQDTQAFIATEGSHYIVRVISNDPSEPGQFTFSEFDKPVDLSPPPSSDYIDSDDL